MKRHITVFTLICISSVLMLQYGCKKSDSIPEPVALRTGSSEYYVKYDFSDTSYHFTSKEPESSYGTEIAICRIGLPNDYYSGIDIELESPEGTNLVYSDIKALEGKYIPYQSPYGRNSQISAIVETLTPSAYYSITLDSAEQKGSFFIEKVTQLPSSKIAPNNKVLEVKGRFNCNLRSDTTTIRNGTFLIKLALWPE